MNNLKKISILTSILLLLSACNQQGSVLSGHDFESGDWLLVHKNYAAASLEIIDDEEFLEANEGALVLTKASDCGGTTCDGFITLYRDGDQVEEYEYLERSTLHEAPAIQAAYQNGLRQSFVPGDDSDFQHKWDSLQAADWYPTRNTSSTDGKGIIFAYRIGVGAP